MKINKIVIHCADTPAEMDIGADTIRKWHVEERGWKDIGYHYVIRRDGTVEKGRADNVPGAHVAGHNTGSLGICLVGGKLRVNFTHQQWAALEKLVRGLLFTHKEAEIFGHNDLDKSKPCPMFNVKAWWYNSAA
jgi:N-acetyl-anhydromuramyl-L-alanine amidase AmpD